MTTANLPPQVIGINTQNIAGIGSPQIMFVPNPHGGFELSYGAAPISVFPLYPHMYGTDYIGFWTPLIRRNYSGANP